MYMICKHDMWIKSLRYRKFSYVAMLMIVFPLLFIFSMSTSPFLTDLVTSVVKASFACFVFLKSYSLTWNPRPIRNVDFQAQFLGNVLMEVIHCLQMGTQFRKAYSWLSPRILSRGQWTQVTSKMEENPLKWRSKSHHLMVFCSSTSSDTPLRSYEHVCLTDPNWVLNAPQEKLDLVGLMATAWPGDSKFVVLDQREYLVGGWPTPLKNMSLSVGMIFPIYGKIYNVPNHQPDTISLNQRVLRLIDHFFW